MPETPICPECGGETRQIPLTRNKYECLVCRHIFHYNEEEE